MAENKIRTLNYTHEEIEYILGKIFNNEYNFLTYDQYDRLINQISLDKICNKDNVSDLRVKYSNIIDAPYIPKNISELVNDRDYITTDAVNRKLNSVAENLRREINDIENNGFIRYAKSIDLANLKASMELKIQEKIEENNLLFGIASKVSRSDLNKYSLASHTHSEFINYNKDIKDLKDRASADEFYQEKIKILTELITTEHASMLLELGGIKDEIKIFKEEKVTIDILKDNLDSLLAILNNDDNVDRDNNISTLQHDVRDLKLAINSKMDKILAESNFNDINTRISDINTRIPDISDINTRISALEDRINNLNNNNSNTGGTGGTGEVDADTLNRISVLEAKLLELESMTLFIDEEE